MDEDINADQYDVKLSIVPSLSQYEISDDIGFLLVDPLDKLPPYFEKWESIATKLEQLLEDGQLRTEVDKMPLVDYNQLNSYREWRLAFLYLSCIANGYVWQNGDSEIAKVLPSQLAIPLCGVADRLCLQPIVSHAGLALANYKLLKRPTCLENLKCLCWFPGGRHCEWFFLVAIQVELDAAGGLKGIIEAIEAVIANNENKCKNALDSMTSSLQKITRTFSRMHEMDNKIFYSKVRPFLAGWGGIESPLPDGLLYEGVSDHHVKLLGASAAQSPAIQAFDVTLRIVHNPEEQAFLRDMRRYMLPNHVAFLGALQKAPNIREYVERTLNAELKDSYNRCVEAMTALRSYHLQMVVKYIQLPSYAKTAAVKYGSIASRGTGGQEPITFLKSVRDTTKKHKVKNCDLKLDTI